MKGKVTELFHYPIKGLTPQPLERVTLATGQGFPSDRVFGFARHDSGLDPMNFRPLPKNRFLVLMTNAELAGLRTSFDPATRHLIVRVQDKTVLDADLGTDAGIERAQVFFAQTVGLGPDEHPVFADAGSNRFTDVSVVSREMMNAVSLINLESVRDLESKIGQDVNPLRFRANIYFDGWPPMSELGLVGRDISIGDTRLRICRRTRRCPATEVNPASAARDLALPKLLQQHYGHSDMGVYAEVLEGGQLAPGAEIYL